jgi:F-type H+-transporting ATPase subunit b
VKSLQSAIKKVLPVLAIIAVLGFSGPRVRAVEQEPVAAQNGSETTPAAANSPEKNKQEEDETDAFRHSATVKAIGAKFGLDAEQAATAFTAGNFLILAGLLGWFLLKALPKTFRDRNSAIQKHLVEARAATEDASARLSSVEARLSKLDEQIAAMRAQAEKDSALDEQRIKASVEEEKQKILSSAEQEIAAATAQARRQIQQYAADLAIDQAAKKLVITAEADRLLVQDFARRLVGEAAKKGQN